MVASPASISSQAVYSSWRAASVCVAMSARSGTRVVTLSQPSREAHAKSFGGIEHVPDEAMTLGVADLLAARRILVLATGAHKAEIVRRALEEPPTPDVPASWLQTHADCTWLLGAAAASRLTSR